MTFATDLEEIKLMDRGPDASAVISYKAVILATGSKSPLITPSPGMSLSERISEVQACGKAMKSARTVVFNGSGLVGVEAWWKSAESMVPMWMTLIGSSSCLVLTIFCSWCWDVVVNQMWMMLCGKESIEDHSDSCALMSLASLMMFEGAWANL